MIRIDRSVRNSLYMFDSVMQCN